MPSWSAFSLRVSKSGTIGYLGGMDIPIIRRIGRGYAEGARWAVPGIAIIDNVTGTTPAGFVDPARGAELARSQFDRGVEVIFAAAGITGFGALQAAKDAGKLAIGMDSNQNLLFPGTVLTSLLRRVDNAVYDALVAARASTWQPGVRSLGLAEDTWPTSARFRSPKDAIAAGIGMVHQHFVLVETVVENLLLGCEQGPLLRGSARRVRADLARFAADFDLALDPMRSPGRCRSGCASASRS